MRIAVIGGREKNETELTRIALAAGYELEVHDGHVAGRGADTIRVAVSRADIAVIVSDINSHGAVFIAKRAARQFKKPTLVLRKFSSARLRGLIAALDRRQYNSASFTGELGLTLQAQASLNA
jgi:hypothetical protein